MNTVLKIIRAARSALGEGKPISVAWLFACALVLTGISPAYSTVSGVDDAGDGLDIAFYYQGDLPVDELQMFDAVVIDPTRVALPASDVAPHTAWFARLNLSAFVREPAPNAQAFVEHVVTPLWNEGYRGFYLDDAMPVDTPAGDAGDRIGAVVAAIKALYPEVRLIMRNHLAWAQAYASELYALVLDGIYHARKGGGYGGALARVPETLRTAVLEGVQAIRAGSSLPIVAIDYCAIGDQVCRRERANTIMADGLTPYVTSRDMATVGVGRIEVMPRTILMVESMSRGVSLDLGLRPDDIPMPLNYLGYDIQYVNVNAGLPAHVSNDRYAGIVVSIDTPVQRAGLWRQWLLARVQEGMKVAVLGQFGFPMDRQAARILGVDLVPGRMPAGAAPQVVTQDAMIGFEIMPAPVVQDAVGIRVGDRGHSLLRVRAGDYIYDAAALLPWGGYALTPFDLVSVDTQGGYRWVVQPLDFFRRALALPDMPVPDLTSENGRRLLFTHVDGDGFASRGEFSAERGEFSGDILYRHVFSKYKIPMSVSVIEGEIGAEGLYPQLTAQLEPIARKIFALPNIEIASHTFSHPFYLNQLDDVTGLRREDLSTLAPGDEGAFSMAIPNYKFDLDREIQGSIDYINRTLAPPGKSVVALFWSGDAAAPSVALQKVADAGVLNINGGDTVITRSDNSWTKIAPYGVAKGDGPDEYQVYAAIMNENVYTNYWLGPFYGYEQVLETFEMTNEPIRFKPVDIYYHFYSGTKQSSLKALRKVFDTVLKQPLMPIYTTDYIHRALQWRHVGVARAGDRWFVRSGRDLRQLRWPGQGVPNMSGASGVAGYLQGPGGLYIHMGKDEASFVMDAAPDSGLPYIAEASGFVREMSRSGRQLRFEFGGYVKPFVQFANAAHCRVSVDGRAQKKNGTANGLRLNVGGDLARSISYHLIEVDCE